MMETDHPHQDRIARVTPLKRPTRTGMGLVKIVRFHRVRIRRSTSLFVFIIQSQVGPAMSSVTFVKRADANAPGDVIVMSGESRELPPETFDKLCFDKK